MIVIDVGAYDGAEVTVPFAKSGEHTIYAIEPIPDLAKKLEERSLSGVSVFNFAIDLQDGVASFFVNQDRQTSSLLPAVVSERWSDYAENLCQESVIDVPVKRLDTFIKENQIEEVDFLKIDTQGNDLNVIKSAGSSIHRVKRLSLEVQLTPLYDGGSTKDDVIEYLEARGFRLSQSSLQTNGLEENLEFIRVNRFVPFTQSSSHGLDVYVPFVGELTFPENDYVAKLLEEGIFEGPEQAFLWLYLRPGDTFFDCGAHVGLFSAIASRVMDGDGTICGFEPNPAVFKLYEFNLERLDHESRQLFNIGLSQQNGEGELSLGGGSKSAFSTFAASDSDEHGFTDGGRVLVEQRSLDSILGESSIDQVALAKLDVEGWEHFVLDGAKQSIETGKFPVWMIEFTEENAKFTGKSTGELRKVLESLGYSLYYFNVTTLLLEPEPIKDSYTYKNLFAVKSIEQVNRRLTDANPEKKATAKQLIRMWDTSFSFYSLRQERVHLMEKIMLAEQDKSASLDSQMQHLHQLSQPLHMQLQEKEALIQDLHTQLLDKETLIQENHAQLLDKNAWHLSIQEQLVEKEALIHELDGHIKTQRRELKAFQKEQTSLQKSIARSNDKLEKQEQQLEQLKLAIAESKTTEDVLRDEVAHLITGKAAFKQFLYALITRLKSYVPGQ